MTIATDNTYAQPNTYLPGANAPRLGKGPAVAATFGAVNTYFNCQTGSYFTVTLTGTASSMEVINPIDGQQVELLLTQDATGTRTVAWDSWIWPAKTAPTLSTTGSSVDRITGIWNNALAKWIGSSSLNIG